MAKRSFPEEDLKLIIWGDKEGFTVVRDTLDDQGRWHTHHSLIFKEEASGKLYQVSYSQGSTEIQDEGPEMTSTPEEVEAYQKTVTEYRKVP